MAGAPVSQVSTLLAFRALIREVFRYVAQGPDADPGDCSEVLAALAEMESDLGERAHRVLDAEARRWRATSRTCPWCGDPAHEDGRPAVTDTRARRTGPPRTRFPKPPAFRVGGAGVACPQAGGGQVDAPSAANTTDDGPTSDGHT